MKLLSILITLLCSSLLGLSQNQEQAFLNAPQKASSELRYGIEGLATWRSEYMYRGFALADSSMEFQLAGQVALSNSDTLDVGFFFFFSTGEGDFTEVAGFVDFSRNIGDLTFMATLTLRDYSNTFFESGADIGGGVRWTVNDAIDLTGKLSYDTGAEGFYFEGKFGYYRQITDDSFLTFDAGLGVVADYYSRDGVHQAFSKLAYTYNINDSVSVSPYIQMSLGIDDQAENHLMGGVYFAVSF